MWLLPQKDNANSGVFLNKNQRFLFRLSIKVQTVKTKYSIILCIALVTAVQTTGHIKYKSSRKACCASILTYCATHTLPYLCTPTSVSCLSLEPFSTVHQRVETVFRHADKNQRFLFLHMNIHLKPHSYRFALFLPFPHNRKEPVQASAAESYKSFFHHIYILCTAIIKPILQAAYAAALYHLLLISGNICKPVFVNLV